MKIANDPYLIDHQSVRNKRHAELKDFLQNWVPLLQTSIVTQEPLEVVNKIQSTFSEENFREKDPVLEVFTKLRKRNELPEMPYELQKVTDWVVATEMKQATDWVAKLYQLDL